MKKFNEILKEVRNQRGIPQKTTAEHLKLPLRTYQSYEYGEREPDIATLKAIANYFDVSLDYLTGRIDEE